MRQLDAASPRDPVSENRGRLFAARAPSRANALRLAPDAFPSDAAPELSAPFAVARGSSASGNRLRTQHRRRQYMVRAAAAQRLIDKLHPGTYTEHCCLVCDPTPSCPLARLCRLAQQKIPTSASTERAETRLVK